jgi:hypothetical protein
MLITFCFSLLLTLLQIATDNDTLALLFPWRTSAFLVPLATAINIAVLLKWFAKAFANRPVKALCGTTLAVLVGSGIAVRIFDLGYPSDAEELPMLAYVDAHKQPGDVYLLPVQVPKLGSGKPGAFSTNFLPAPRKSNNNLIAIDLQRFRLFTGAPLFVDFKSIPYKDVEVVEWYRRLLWAHKIYTDPDWSAHELRTELKRGGITHVVAGAADGERFGWLEPIYEDGSYRLYALEPQRSQRSQRKER